MLFAIDYRGNVLCFDHRRMAIGDSGTSRPWAFSTHCFLWCLSGGHIAISFRPSFVTPLARGRLMSWLRGDSPIRIHLAYWMAGIWHHEIVGNAAIAVQRVDALIGGYCREDQGAVRQRRMSERDIERNTRFKDAVGFWRQHRQTFDMAEHYRLLSTLTSHRCTLLEVASNGDYSPVRVATAIAPSMKKWLDANPDAPLSAFPDREFSRHAARCYDTARESMCPFGDEVDLLLTWPGDGRKRYSYHRLVLPLEGQGKRWILTSTFRDAAVNLLD